MAYDGQIHCTQNIQYQFIGGRWKAIASAYCPLTAPFPDGVQFPQPEDTDFSDVSQYNQDFGSPRDSSGQRCGSLHAKKCEDGQVYECLAGSNGVDNFWFKKASCDCGCSKESGSDSTPLSEMCKTDCDSIIPSPTPQPSVIGQLYEIDIQTPIAPALPYWIVEKIRNVAARNGWFISNISNNESGYKIQAEKRGSITAALLLIVISGVLALLLIKVITATITRLSDNKRDTAVSSDIAKSVETIKNYCESAGLTPDECNQLLENLKGIYGEAIPDPLVDSGGGFLGGLNETLGLGLVAILAIAAIK